MAKTDGTQDIPSALLDKYRATLGSENPKKVVGKRYPYRVPTMQDGRGNVTTKQATQRARFKTVRDQFNALSPAERARWYDAMPPYSSLLWYYNYFMLSGLMDVLGADGRGASVIKSIQNRTIEVPIAGTTITHAAVIDATKAVAMLWGNSYHMTSVFDLEGFWHYPIIQIFPIWGTLNNTNISLTWSLAPDLATKVSLQVIEYL